MITINVTQKHINNGISGDDTSCPIALSLKTKQKKSVFVSNGDIIRIRNRDYIGINPKEVRRISRFIGRFDNGYKVKPTTFKIKTTNEHKT